MEIRYWILLTFLGALWGSAFMFIKVATPEFGPVALVNTRLVIASIIFLPILLRNKYIHLLRPIWKQVLVLAIMNNAIPFTLFSYASFGADSNILAILNATTAFNTMMIAYIWIGENVTIKQLFGLIIGFIGVFILVNPQNSSTTLISRLETRCNAPGPRETGVECGLGSRPYRLCWAALSFETLVIVTCIVEPHVSGVLHGAS